MFMKIKKLSFVVWLVALCVALSAVYMPAFAADAAVYYTSEPTVSGNTVSAKVMNTSGSDVMFIAAAYSGNSLIDANVESVPSGGETAVSATLGGASNGVKCYLWSDNSIAPYGEPVAAVFEKLPAFPGAEGGGMWTTGARGGDKPEVYHVYKLTDDGSYGTLRDAVSQPNRIIVFDVAGNIELSDTLTIKADDPGPDRPRNGRVRQELQHRHHRKQRYSALHAFQNGRRKDHGRGHDRKPRQAQYNR